VRLGVEHHSSDTSGSSEKNSTSDNNSNSPVREKRDDVDSSLLISVREVVVSSAHVEERSGLVHLEDSSIVVVKSGIELSAVLDILLSVSSIVSVGGEDLSSGKAVLLVKSGERNSGSSVLDEDLLGVGRDPSIGDGVCVIGVDDLNVVGSVSLISSFSSISSGVSVASSPLEVNVISDSGIEILGDEIVLGGRVSLNNVATLSSNVQVIKSS